MIQTKIRQADLNISENEVIKYKDSECVEIFCMPGIGDAIWGLMYLFKNNTRKMKIHTLPRSNFTSHFLSSLENVISVDQDFSLLEKYHKGSSNYFYFSGLCEHYRQFHYYKLKSFDDLNDNKIFLGLNQFLDYGRRIEEYLPNMKVSFDIPWKFKINPYKHDKPYIVLFTSSSINNNPKISSDVSDKWYPNKWNEIVISIKNKYPNLDIIWAGNSHDATILNNGLDKSLLDNIKLDLGAEDMMNLLHGSLGNISYQNGVGHVGIYHRIPTYFLTFPRLDKISYAWTQPGIENDKILYRPVFFDKFEIDDLLFWVSQIYKG